jgi:F420-dependent oxidoreductase-like protein
MRVGLQMPHFRPSADKLGGWIKDVVQTADQSGYYSYWVMDHFFQLGRWLGPPEDAMLEGYTTLGYAAGVSQRLKLGLMVTGVVYRHPSVLIKTVTTLDVVSGGRAYLGIGAAWNDYEAKSLGLPFPPLKDRYVLLEETLQLAHRMWSGDTSPFAGTTFKAEYPVSSPQPVSKPHPPILIGGEGEKKTLRLVAQYGDACNLFGRLGEDVLRHKLDVLKGHCEAAGRPYDAIEKTVLDTVNFEEESSADVVKRWKGYAALGVSHVIHNIGHDYDAKTITRIGREIIPEMAGL